MIPWWVVVDPSGEPPTLAESLVEATRQLEQIAGRLTVEMAVMVALERRIEATGCELQALTTALQRFSAAGDDAAEVLVLTQKLKHSTDSLAAAVAAHKQE